jgi:hypothetical protein
VLVTTLDVSRGRRTFAHVRAERNVQRRTHSRGVV